MKRLILALALTAAPFACVADNIRPFTEKHPHPVCGINPYFDEVPRNVPISPFATCRTLAMGFGAETEYPDPGTTALARLIVAIAEASSWDKMFGPLNTMVLNCRPNMPVGLEPMPGTPSADVPICTRAVLKSFLQRYNQQEVVRGFKQFERNVQQLDLSGGISISKLRQAEAMVRAAGGTATFADIAEVLE